MSKTWKASDTYEYSDFNRVEQTTKAAYAQFRKAMSLHDGIETVTNRTIESIFVVEDINRIEKNLKYVDFSGTFRQKHWEEGGSFTYEDANRWEIMVELLQKAMVGIQSIRCGTHRCGTWPRISVIGAVVKCQEICSGSSKSGVFDATACGTVPEYSIIGYVVRQEYTIEAAGATTTFSVDGCGTKPDQSQIGAVIRQIIEIDAAGGSTAFPEKAAGMKRCGEEA